MIPLAIYESFVIPGNLLGFVDFQLELAVALGYGPEPTDWTTDEVSELYRRINEANRWVQLPSLIPGEQATHVWSHLRILTTLTMVADQQAYGVASDFGAMHDVMVFTDTNSYPPVVRTAASEIEKWQSYGTSLRGRPSHYGIRWKRQNTGANQEQEIIFWPVPDGAYVVQYRYDINPPAITASNPYVLGGLRMAQLMLDACRAIGETIRNGMRGPNWGAFMERLVSAIQLDKRTLTAPTVGIMRSGMRSCTALDTAPLGGYPSFEVAYA